jgi:hypothetical protein
VENHRRTDPYFLTSVVVMSGTTLSEGHHVYVDRKGPWRDAMRLLIKKAVAIYEREKADAIMFRDCPADDAEMSALMLDEGLLSVPILDSHLLPITWSDAEGLVTRLGPNSRPRVRKALREASNFEIRTYGASVGGTLPSATELEHLWSLYRNLVRRKFRINIFELPPNLLAEMLQTNAWELVTLTLKPSCGGPAHGRPVAWFASHVHDGHYAALIAGLDYDYVIEKGVYRQLLLQVILRAQALGMRAVRLGMDADFEKARYKTTIVRNVVYTQAREHFNSSILREIVADVGAADSAAIRIRTV